MGRCSGSHSGYGGCRDNSGHSANYFTAIVGRRAATRTTYDAYDFRRGTAVMGCSAFNDTRRHADRIRSSNKFVVTNTGGYARKTRLRRRDEKLSSGRHARSKKQSVARFNDEHERLD